MKTCTFALNRTRHRFSSARNAAYQGGTFLYIHLWKLLAKYPVVDPDNGYKS